MANLDVIKMLLQREEKTIVDLAKFLNTTQQNVHRIFRSNKITVEFLEQSAKYLDVPISILFNKEFGGLEYNEIKFDDFLDRLLIIKDKLVRAKIFETEKELAEVLELPLNKSLTTAIYSEGRRRPLTLVNNIKKLAPQINSDWIWSGEGEINL
ncbi:MAG: hypothetical protein UIG52_00510 [Bacteroidales bacterium]|nr:hypothetical protein [Bacteroidales bacterium]